MKTSENNTGAATRLPPWLRVSCRGGTVRTRVRRLLADLDLNTVCASAQCPNLCQCWENGTATFMILGRHCTRNCAFCAVDHADPEAVQTDEPERVAEAAVRLGLNFVVVTSVTRDDLNDGGAEHFARTISAVRERSPETGVEVLTPDFRGDVRALEKVLDRRPTVFNHNIETCRRLTGRIRPEADYDQSLAVLGAARQRVVSTGSEIILKSGMMLGLGETEEEIHRMLGDLRECGVNVVTIGQYLPPSRNHWTLERYVHPDEFEAWRRTALETYGFSYVASAPLVRSSYLAHEAAAEVRKSNLQKQA